MGKVLEFLKSKQTKKLRGGFPASREKIISILEKSKDLEKEIEEGIMGYVDGILPDIPQEEELSHNIIERYLYDAEIYFRRDCPWYEKLLELYENSLSKSYVPEWDIIKLMPEETSVNRAMKGFRYDMKEFAIVEIIERRYTFSYVLPRAEVV